LLAKAQESSTPESEIRRGFFEGLISREVPLLTLTFPAPLQVFEICRVDRLA